MEQILNGSLEKVAEYEAKNEMPYSQLIHSLQIPIYTTDTEGVITSFNKAAAALWGREPEIGKDYWCGSYKIYKPDGSDMPFDECPMAVCLKEKRPVHGEEIVVMRPDGSARNVAPHPEPIFNSEGNMVGAVNMLVDITTIKNTERALKDNERKFKELASALEKKVEEKTNDLRRKNEELKKSEERYHKMVEEVEDYAIILMDRKGIIQNWNRGAEKIKGYKEEEIVGQSFEKFYSEEDRKKGVPRTLINEATLNGKAVAEGWRMRKDGSKFWALIVITALHNENNDIIGFSKVTRDLTERKYAEDKLREYSSELEFQNKELEQFVYAASHDMKEPLRKIHLYNTFISESKNNVLDAKSADYLHRSVLAVKRMNDLIEDLLTYSRTTSNTESFGNVDFNKLVDDLTEIHRDELEHTNTQVVRGKLPVIKAVPFQCKQLLDNLLNNSIKYKHPDRDALVSIHSEIVKGAAIKEEKAEANKLYHRISVVDNGIGFEPAYAKKIFEIFQRLNNVSATKGSGIGLAICKKIMQNHKGFISATANLNEGACFDIYFPVNN